MVNFCQEKISPFNDALFRITPMILGPLKKTIFSGKRGLKNLYYTELHSKMKRGNEEEAHPQRGYPGVHLVRRVDDNEGNEAA